MLAILMVFNVAVFILVLAWYRGYIGLEPPQWRSPWLMLVAFVVWALLYNSNPLVKFVSLQIIGLTFLAVNHQIPGIWLLALGTVANAIPTLTNGNGGLMPVSAELMPYLVSEEVKWEVYKRIGWSVVLPADEINFYWLSDWIFVAVVGKAYSPGDLITLAGMLWVLVKIVKAPKQQKDALYKMGEDSN